MFERLRGNSGPVRIAHQSLCRSKDDYHISNTDREDQRKLIEFRSSICRRRLLAEAFMLLYQTAV